MRMYACATAQGTQQICGDKYLRQPVIMDVQRANTNMRRTGGYQVCQYNNHPSTLSTLKS